MTHDQRQLFSTKENRVTQKSAVKHDTPVPQSYQRKVERDTLNDTPELRFLRDEIEALLGSSTVQRATRQPMIDAADDHEAVAPEDLGREWLERATESEENVELPEQDPEGRLETVPIEQLAENENDEAEDAEVNRAERAVIRDSFFDRDTEPSVEAKLVNEVVRTAGK